MSRKNVVKIIVFILFFMIEISDIYAVVDEEKIHSSNVGVYNIEDMSLIYGKNIDERISIASITKVMTAIVAVENVEDVYNSEAFFCRKVDLPVSSELLDLIDMKRECPFDINKALPISNSE